MFKLDKVDLKILNKLEENCRKSNGKIAKELNLSRQVVKYRIDRLVEAGVISSFGTLINFNMLGLNFCSIFLKMKPGFNKKEEFIDFLFHHKPVNWIGELIGEWDYLFGVIFKDIEELENFFSLYLSKFSDDISAYETIYDLGFYHFCGKVLYEGMDVKSSPFHLGLRKPKYAININDLKILRFIANNGRFSYMDCAKACGLSTNTIKSRIKYMMKHKLIAGFSIEIDYTKLGYHWLIFFLRLREFSKNTKKRIISLLLKEPNVTFVINTPGNLIDFDLQALTSIDIDNVYKKIMKNFSSVLRSVKYTTVIKTYKRDFFPYLIESL